MIVICTFMFVEVIMIIFIITFIMMISIAFFDDYYLSQDQIWSGDMTSDNILDITDIVFLVNFIFVH